MAYSPANIIESRHHARLTDGRLFHLQHADGTWYVFIDGRYYCAVDPEILIKGIESKHHLYRPPPAPIHKPPLQIADETLRDENSSLIARQEAREVLKTFAAKGDVMATLLLEALEKKPVSAAARTITAQLKKYSFADVTHEELVQHVSNLVLRNKLILELSERLRF